MAARDPKPNAQNQQHHAGRYTATTFRFSPRDLKILDALVAEHEETEGRPTNRSELVRAILHERYRARISTTLPPEPKRAKQPRSDKGKPKPKPKRSN